MTLFKPELALAIAQGRKTQTRRLMADDDVLVVHRDGDDESDNVFRPADFTNGFGISRTANQLYYASYATLVRNNRVKFDTTRDYAVQTKRGGKGRLHSNGLLLGNDTLDVAGIWKPLRFRVTHIGAEDVRNISFDDAKAEGFVNCLDFLYTWVQLNDKVIGKYIKDTNVLSKREDVIDLQYERLINRPAVFYRAWIIEFEVVK